MNRPPGANADEWLLFLSEHKDALPFVAVQIAEALEALEKKVYVPGQWRCAKCDFRLTQSNLYAATGTIGPRDEPGDKCPNCNGPLWRVSAMDDRHEAYKCANDAFDRMDEASKKSAALADSAYIAGAKAGFNLGLNENHDGLQEIVSARNGYLAELAPNVGSKRQ